MLTKVAKHSKNNLQAKKQTWVQFVFAVPWIIRNKMLPPIVGRLPLSYIFLSYCNGLLKILQRVQICSVLCTSRELKSFQLQGGFAPWPGAVPLDPTGGCAPDPHYRLALHALAMCPQNANGPLLFQYGTLAPALTAPIKRAMLNTSGMQTWFTAHSPAVLTSLSEYCQWSICNPFKCSYRLLFHMFLSIFTAVVISTGRCLWRQPKASVVASNGRFAKNENDLIRFSARNDSIRHNQLHVIW